MKNQKLYYLHQINKIFKLDQYTYKLGENSIEKRMFNYIWHSF